MAISLIPAASAVSGTLPAANLPTGSVLQVIYATYGTTTSNSTNTYADTNLTATITPKFSTSKILVLINQNGISKYNGNSENQVAIQLLRGASVLVQFEKVAGYNNINNYNMVGSSSCNYLDSPATTSATTYKTQFKNSGGNFASVYVQEGNSVSDITLMEIAA
jgi:hypothetical protein